MHARFALAAALSAALCLCAGCASSATYLGGGPPAEMTERDKAREAAWRDPEGRLRLRAPWMISQAGATRALRAEQAKTTEALEPALFGDSVYSYLKDEFWPFYREYNTPDDLKMLALHEKLRPKPGPPLAGKFDREALHWLDWEHVEAARFQADYRSRLYADADVQGQSADMGLAQQDLTVRGQTIEAWMVTSAFLKLRTIEFCSRPRLAHAGRKFPPRLTDLQVGFMFPWVLPPGIYNITVGSASDRPFASGDEITADVTWAYGTPQGGTESLLVYVNWQNNRDFLNRCPVPGGMYRYKQGNWFTLALGFPYNALAWRPTEKLELSASYEFPRTVFAQIACRPCKPLKVHAGFDWTNQRYYRHDRRHVRDRLWFDEKRLTLGVRWDVNDQLYLDVCGGYAFDRFWFEGQTYEDRDYNRTNIADGPFIGLQLGARF